MTFAPPASAYTAAPTRRRGARGGTAGARLRVLIELLPLLEQLVRHEAGVRAVLGEQRLVRPNLSGFPLVHHNDRLRVDDR